MKENAKNHLPFFDVVKDGVDAVLETSEFLIQQNQGSFENYINKRAAELDKYILDQEKLGGLAYAAGEVNINLIENDEFYLEAQFYFKDKCNGWVKKSIKGRAIKLSWEFAPEFQQALKESKVVSFEYERPEK